MSKDPRTDSPIRIGGIHYNKDYLLRELLWNDEELNDMIEYFYNNRKKLEKQMEKLLPPRALLNDD